MVDVLDLSAHMEQQKQKRQAEFGGAVEFAVGFYSKLDPTVLRTSEEWEALAKNCFTAAYSFMKTVSKEENARS